MQVRSKNPLKALGFARLEPLERVDGHIREKVLHLGELLGVNRNRVDRVGAEVAQRGGELGALGQREGPDVDATEDASFMI